MKEESIQTEFERDFIEVLDSSIPGTPEAILTTERRESIYDSEGPNIHRMMNFTQPSYTSVA